MIHFIAAHLLAAIGVVVFFALIVPLAAWCICRITALHDEPNLIEPGDLSGGTVSASATVELTNLGFDVKNWGTELLQITDSDGITFYMPLDATLKQCMDRYREKCLQFSAA